MLPLTYLDFEAKYNRGHREQLFQIQTEKGFLNFSTRSNRLADPLIK